jgi:deoxyribodipyrimidine photo-lyase
MTGPAPTIWWVRRDLRLADNPALAWAAERGGPVIPVFVHDELVEAMGAAPRWRLERGLAHLGAVLEGKGSRLILRRGPAAGVLTALAEEAGARALAFNRLFVHPERRRDASASEALKAAGVEVHEAMGHLLFDPAGIRTGTGGIYKVYTPFWKNVRARDPGAPEPAPDDLPAPEVWPGSDALEGWRMGAAMNRGAAVVARHARIGEAAARDRLDRFLEKGLHGYARTREELARRDGSTKLSENLAIGEIGPRTCWAAARAELERGNPGAETLLREIAWRDFAHHLAWHTPELTEGHWRPEWARFPWRKDNPQAEAWRRGRTGVPVVDAAMREMYVTGTMHNRARMISASYLVKHLLTDWRLGAAWFADCLIDHDPANNAMGWQWIAGSGPDASPFFRIFNPETQAGKFDAKRMYRRHWIAEGRADPTEDALSYFDAVPRSWNLSPDDPYPSEPVVGLAEGRQRALDAFREAKEAMRAAS